MYHRHCRVCALPTEYCDLSPARPHARRLTVSRPRRWAPRRNCRRCPCRHGRSFLSPGSIAKFSAFSASSGRVRRAFTIQCSVFSVQDSVQLRRFVTSAVLGRQCIMKKWDLRGFLCGGSNQSRPTRREYIYYEELTLPARMHIDRSLLPIW